MRVAIGSDHAGFEQKEQLAAYLQEAGYEVINVGPYSDDRCDYPDFADKVARLVAGNEAARGVLVCGTGIGVAMAADKVPGVRATPIQTEEFARLCRQHNDANVIGLSGRFVSVEDNKTILDTFLTTEFEGGRHAERVGKIMREDDPHFAGVPATFGE